MMQPLIMKSKGVFVADPRLIPRIKRDNPNLPVQLLIPSVPCSLPSRTDLRNKNTTEKSPLYQLGILCSEHNSHFKQLVLKTIAAYNQTRAIKLKPTFFSLPFCFQQHIPAHKFHLRKIYNAFVRFTEEIDFLLSANFGPSWLEFRLLSAAMATGIPLIVYYDSLLQGTAAQYVLTIYPGNTEIEQITKYLDVLTEDDKFRLYLAQAGAKLFRWKYNPDLIRKSFFTSLVTAGTASLPQREKEKVKSRNFNGVSPEEITAYVFNNTDFTQDDLVQHHIIQELVSTMRELNSPLKA